MVQPSINKDSVTANWVGRAWNPTGVYAFVSNQLC